MKSKRIKPWNKITIGILAAFLIMSLTACGSASSTGNSSSSSSKTTVEKQELEDEFKILNEKERREVYDKYNFNIDNGTYAIDVLETYDIDTDETSQLDGPFYFDVPSDPNSTDDSYTGSLSNLFYNFYLPENTSGIEDGYILVDIGKPGRVRPLKSDTGEHGYEETVEVFNFETKEVVGYIEATTYWKTDYFVYVQSKRVADSEPVMLCHVFADSYERTTETGDMLNEIANAIVSQILESCVKQVN